ncbi:hypothetical protein [Kutzneria kofuensis]|uniref:hypothetical protein n=1 Tax=Kutzneria kofuensis TaxID=103725 RepID=UPI0031EE854E
MRGQLVLEGLLVLGHIIALAGAAVPSGRDVAHLPYGRPPSDSRLPVRAVHSLRCRAVKDGASGKPPEKAPPVGGVIFLPS